MVVESLPTASIYTSIVSVVCQVVPVMVIKSVMVSLIMYFETFSLAISIGKAAWETAELSFHLS